MSAQMSPEQLYRRFNNGQCSNDTLREVLTLLRSKRSLSIVEGEMLRLAEQVAKRLRLRVPSGAAASDGRPGVDGPERLAAEVPDPRPVFSMGGLHFDSYQAGVVRAPIQARCIVNAPPGTGKTHVACGRIAWLLSQGLYETEIQVESFTRAAIAELKARAEHLSDSIPALRAVSFSTLDQRAWRSLQAFRGTGAQAISLGYDATVAAFAELLRVGDEGLLESLAEIRHLIIDEAQDIVGQRADAYINLIARLPRDAGVTILCDEAQAIFNFSEEDSSPFSGTIQNGGFVERVRELSGTPFDDYELRCVHRTSNEALRSLYTSDRTHFLSLNQGSPKKSLETIDAALWGMPQSGGIAFDDTLLILHRRRIDVFESARLLSAKDIPFRVRMSQVDTPLAPWIGVVLSDFTERRLTWSEFSRRWHRIETLPGATVPNCEEAWYELVSLGRGDEEALEMTDLREVLSTPTRAPNLVRSELGFSGPILSTIHASKGREAANVLVHLPTHLSERNAAEEARVWFVAGSRAKENLHVVRKPGLFLGHNRHAVFQRDSIFGEILLVRVGEKDDVDGLSVVGQDPNNLLPSIHEAQEWLAHSCGSVRPLAGVRSEQYRYDLYVDLDKTLRVGKLDATRFLHSRSSLPRNLRNSADAPSIIRSIPCIGARTFVVPPGVDMPESIPEPYRSSGMWLAPLLCGNVAVPIASMQRGAL